MRMISEAEMRQRDTVYGVPVSVPHNGTRTLVHHLDLPASPAVPAKKAWLHFGQNDIMLRRCKHVAHIPIRHPLDVARSWARRVKDGKPWLAIVKSYDLMFEYLDKHPEARLYRIEDLPVLAGSGEKPDGPTSGHPVNRFTDIVQERVIEPHRDFFQGYYEDI